MRCADPNCVDQHRHMQVLELDPSSSIGPGGGEEEKPLPPPLERLIGPLDVAVDPPPLPEDESIFMVGTQGAKVTIICGLEPWAGHLKCLVLRSNLISSLAGVEQLVKLEKLELYDNCVEDLKVDHLQKLHSLVVLDLSFNSIRTMAAVSCCPLLQELYLAQNKLKVIEGLDGLVNLKILDLGANRIRTLEGGGLEGLASLQSLWLGKNKIEHIGTVIGHLTNLRKLDVQNNRLKEVQPGEIPPSVEELYLASNGISRLLWLGQTHQIPGGVIQTLDLSRNPLGSLEGIEILGGTLEELWLTGVALESAEQLEPLRALGKLSCIYLEHSPFAKALEGNPSLYKSTLVSLAPTLLQIDALMI